MISCLVVVLLMVCCLWTSTSFIQYNQLVEEKFGHREGSKEVDTFYSLERI
jgi:uncharacterized membrane protein